MNLRTSLLFAAFSLAAVSSAQSINLDLDVFFGDPSNGNGAPSSSFGAAAGQPGYWNRVDAGTTGPDALLGLSGELTTATYRVLSGSGSAGGSNFPINTGDYSLLLNDYARIPDEMRFEISGIIPGRYQVYTYAVNATGETVTTSVDIFGQILTTTGPMPGNSFAEGITHTVHTGEISGTTLSIRLIGNWPYSEVNGFQIVAVPEPATLGFLAAGGLFAIRRRRTSSFGATS